MQKTAPAVEVGLGGKRCEGNMGGIRPNPSEQRYFIANVEPATFYGIDSSGEGIEVRETCW